MRYLQTRQSPLSSGQDMLRLRSRTESCCGLEEFLLQFDEFPLPGFFTKGRSGRASPLFVWPLRCGVASWCEALLPSRPTAGLARTTPSCRMQKPHMVITQVRFTGVSLTSIHPATSFPLYDFYCHV